MDDKKKDPLLIQKDLKKNCSQQLQIHSVPTEDMENAKDIFLGRRYTIC